MQEEKYGSRDMSYSAWHRRMSTKRFVGMKNAELLAMIDVDACMYIEYDEFGRDPVGLFEIAIDVGQSHKTATVMTNLARKANIPCAVVLYKLSRHDNPAYMKSRLKIKLLLGL